jgi:hypothetical protein
VEHLETRTQHELRAERKLAGRAEALTLQPSSDRKYFMMGMCLTQVSRWRRVAEANRTGARMSFGKISEVEAGARRAGRVAQTIGHHSAREPE